MDFRETWASVELSFLDIRALCRWAGSPRTPGQLPHLTFAIRQAKIKLTTWELMWKKTLTNLGGLLRIQDIYTKMRAGDFEMADFEVDGKSTRIALLPSKNFYQNHGNAEVREKPLWNSFSERSPQAQNILLPYLTQVKSKNHDYCL